MESIMYVRLKPHNPKLGHLVQRYHYKHQLYITDNETSRTVWYKVPQDLAMDLIQHRQNEKDPLSQLLFDVVGEEEHKGLLVQEENLRLVQLGLTTAAAVQSVAVPKGPVDLVAKAAAGRADAVPGPEVTALPMEPDPKIPADHESVPNDLTLEDITSEPEPEVAEDKKPRRRGRGRSRS